MPPVVLWRPSSGSDIVAIPEATDERRVAAIGKLAGAATTTNNAAVRLALQMLAPAEPDLNYKFERVNDGSNAQPSNGVAASGQVAFDWQLPADGNGNAYSCIILMRQAGRAAIVNTSNIAAAGYCYTWLGPQLAQQSWSAPVGTQAINPCGGISNPVSSPVGTVPGTSFYPHGVIMGAGYLQTGDGGNYLWADVGTGNTTSINIISSSNLPATLYASLWAQVDDEEVKVGNSVAASGSSPYLQLFPGYSAYYRIKLTNTGTSDVNNLVIFTACGPCPNTGITATASQPACSNIWAHLSLPALYDNGFLATVSGILLVGLSFKLSNFSATLFKNGAITAATIGSSLDWQQTITSGTNLVNSQTYQNVAQLNRFKDLDAANGWYGVCKPGGVNGFQWENDILYGTGAATNTAVLQYPLVNTSPYVAMVGSVVTSNTIAPPTTKGFIRAVYQTYNTTTQQNTLERPTSSYAQLQAAVEVVNKAQQFWENPLHLSDVAELVGTFLPLLGQGAAEVATGLGYGSFANPIQDYSNKGGALLQQFAAGRKRRAMQDPNWNPGFWQG